MFKSDTEVETLISHPNNGLGKIKIIGSGQDDRSDRTPQTRGERLTLDQKSNIAVLASIIGIKGTGELLGKTPGVISRIKNGKNSQGDPDLKLQDSIDETKRSLQEKALSRADQFLDMLGLSSDNKDEYLKASIAEKAVSIYDKLAPKVAPTTNNTQIVFYAPRIKESKEYQVIEVEAQNG